MAPGPPDRPQGLAPDHTTAYQVLEINSRLRRALADVTERERTIRQQAERLALLNEFARTISTTLDLDSVFTLVVRQVAALLKCQRCTITQRDPETGSLRPRASWPAPRVPEAHSHEAPANHRCLTAPITIADAAWGEISICFESPEAATHDRLDFLHTIASHLALAIRNAELYTQVHDSHQELVTAQRQLIQQERLRALGEMASGIAHDLNNALAPVLGFAELLVDQPAVRANPDRLLHYLRLILTGASDAAAVVKRLREFYRSRAEDETLAPVHLSALVRETIALSEPKWRNVPRAEGRSIDVRTDLIDAPPCAGRESELREMLMNLLFNAVDACSRGGTITVRTQTVPESPGFVALEVEDTGDGMTPEVKQRCLEPFFTTKGEQGTGMGMAMVYGTVQRHGGRLQIKSALGCGTTVRVLLPEYTPESQRAIAPAAGGTPQPQTARLAVGSDALRVLVADDEPLLRAVVSEFLTAAGHTAEAAPSGDRAWELFRDGSYDLLITDRAMPGMSGEQLAQRVKALRPSTPVILLTGFGDLMNAAGELPPGVDVVLGKPVTLVALRAGIAAATERAARRRAA